MYSQIEKMILIFRALNLIAASFFTLSAFVQYNDPDPELWIPVYMFPAFVSGLISLKPSISKSGIIKTFDVGYIFCGTIFSSYLVHKNYTDNFIHWVVHDEVGREFGGLVIVMLWLIFMHDTAYLTVKICVFSFLILIPISLWVYVYLNQDYRKLWPEHCQTALYPENDSS